MGTRPAVVHMEMSQPQVQPEAVIAILLYDLEILASVL